MPTQAFIVAVIPYGLKQNSSFTVTLRASDGAAMQAETMPIVIKASCHRYWPAAAHSRRPGSNRAGQSRSQRLRQHLAFPAALHFRLAATAGSMSI
jgi:hypothetical protein